MRSEFEMFGQQMAQHEDRYAYALDWIEQFAVANADMIFIDLVDVAGTEATIANLRSEASRLGKEGLGGKPRPASQPPRHGRQPADRGRPGAGRRQARGAVVTGHHDPQQRLTAATTTHDREDARG